MINLTLYDIARGLQRPFDGLGETNFSELPLGENWNISSEELEEFLKFLNDADKHVSNRTFFDTYFSSARFAVETVVASLAGLFNLLALIIVKLADTKHGPAIVQNTSPYNGLFINLAVANMLTCLLSWFGNNVIYLFEEKLYYHIFTGTNICQLFVYLQAIVYVTSGFGVVSTLTMLGFTVVQYFAICRPLHHLSIIRRRRVVVFIGLSWGITMVFCCVPFVVLMITLGRRACDEEMFQYLLQVIKWGANVCMILVAIIYFIIIAICCRVFLEIRLLQRRLSQLRFQQHVLSQKRAFFTTVILLVTFALFLFPYSSVFIYTLNSNSSINSPIHDNALIYYMIILPYLKFLTDPIIYGMRMREVQGTLMQAAWGLGFDRCPCFKCDVLPPTPSTTMALHHFTSLSHGLGIESREMAKDIQSKERMNDLVLAPYTRSHMTATKM